MSDLPNTLADDFRFAVSDTRSDGTGVAIYVRGPMRLSPGVLEAARRAAADLNAAVEESLAKEDPETEVAARACQAELTGIFTRAGLDPVYVERIPNEYWPHAYPRLRMRSPWLRVTTRHGPFKVGWRKRVIEIDWSWTDFNSLLGATVFPNAGFTVAENYVHATSVEEAASRIVALMHWAQP